MYKEYYEDKGIKIVNVGGRDALNKDIIRKYLDESKTNLILFDIDKYSYKEAIENIKRQIPDKENKLEYKIFLFPKNKERDHRGPKLEFENLLEEIINNKHKKVLECFSEYQECIKTEGYNVTGIKAKLYAYITTISTQDKSKPLKWYFCDSKYWNLKSEALEPLKSFFIENIDPVP